jgi:insertion element IS1 protein InsB
MNFMVTCFVAAPEQLHRQLPGRSRAVIMQLVEAEADEVCSFVKKKANKRWLWLAMNRTTRQVIAFHVSDRSRDSARQLWANLKHDRFQAVTPSHLCILFRCQDS